jgi:uncharacterized membrane protein
MIPGPTPTADRCLAPFLDSNSPQYQLRVVQTTGMFGGAILMNSLTGSGILQADVWALAGPLRSLKISPQYYYVGLALLVVLLVVALVKVYRVWEEVKDVEEPDSPADLLRAFEEARAAGELDDEEMERVRRQLARSEAPVDTKKRPLPTPVRDEDLAEPDQ